MQRAPTTSELLNELRIQQALEHAWLDSQPADPANRHEEGGWIYMDTSTGAITIRRAPAGARAALDLTQHLCSFRAPLSWRPFIRIPTRLLKAGSAARALVMSS